MGRIKSHDKALPFHGVHDPITGSKAEEEGDLRFKPPTAKLLLKDAVLLAQVVDDGLLVLLTQPASVASKIRQGWTTCATGGVYARRETPGSYRYRRKTRTIDAARRSIEFVDLTGVRHSFVATPSQGDL